MRRRAMVTEGLPGLWVPRAITLKIPRCRDGSVRAQRQCWQPVARGVSLVMVQHLARAAHCGALDAKRGRLSFGFWLRRSISFDDAETD